MERFLSRREASEAVGDQGWRFVLGTLRTAVPVGSLAEAVAAGTCAAEACGADADDHLRLDLRPSHVSLTLRPRAFGGITARDTELALQITAALRTLGLTTTPGALSAPPQAALVALPEAPAADGVPSAEASLSVPPRAALVALPEALTPDAVPPAEAPLSSRLAPRVPSPPQATRAERTTRSVQEWEIAIDALDIASVRPFWKAVLGYTDEVGKPGPEDRLVDPWREGPAVWFQRMTEPRPQRNRIHFDISVPHDEAQGRIAAALAAGGRLVSDDRAPSFWVLADREGNEVCVTTWQGRD